MPVLYDLAAPGLLKISGADAKKLLQGQLTCNLDEVRPLQGAMGAHCSPQGRVISLFYLFMLADAYYLLLPHSMLPIATAALKKFAVFYKAELHDVSAELVIIGVDENNISHDENIARVDLHNKRTILLGHPGDIQAICNKFKNSTSLLTDQAWHARNIAEKIPAVYPETSGKFLPHEINLPELNAVHFDKGCYTGQEIIARMHYRGKLKTHLFKASIKNEGLPAPGTSIFFNQDNQLRTGGTIVDACQKEYNIAEVLLITDELNAKDKHLFLHKNDNFFTF